jgi:hypothetical protein
MQNNNGIKSINKGGVALQKIWITQVLFLNLSSGCLSYVR